MEEPSPSNPTTDEEKLRAQLEEEMRRARVEDLLMQSVAGIVNLSARRIVKEDERDLAQAKLGIDAVRALVDLLPAEAAAQVREALSQVQLLYAKASAENGEAAPSGEAGEAETQPPPQADAGAAPPEPPQEPGQPPRREPPPRLWTPPGSV